MICVFYLMLITALIKEKWLHYLDVQLTILKRKERTYNQELTCDVSPLLILKQSEGLLLGLQKKNMRINYIYIIQALYQWD